MPFQAPQLEPVAEIFAHDPYADPKDEGIGSSLRRMCRAASSGLQSWRGGGSQLHLHSVPKDGGELVVMLG